MAVTPLTGFNPSSPAPATGWAPFALGFRPFFLLALLLAPVSVLLWVWVFVNGAAMPTNYFGAAQWHAHEMLFAYSTAVIAGFLLTAVGNWTGQKMLSGLPLAALALLWVAGRVVSWTSLPDVVIAAVELSWLPLVAVALFVPIVRGKHWKSLTFPVMVSVLFVANLLVHLQRLGVEGFQGIDGIQIALVIVLVMITVMGGRVIPFFTERGVGAAVSRSFRWVELAVVPVTLLFGVATVLGWASGLVAAIALLAAVLHGVRILGWFGKGVLAAPMVWVLQLGYVWMPVGFLLAAASHVGWIPLYVPLHAFTAGTIAILTVGMMARVTLGHTGRNVMQPPRIVPIAFVILALVAVVRVLLPWLVPGLYALWVSVAGIGWGVAYALMLVATVPMLLRVRVDGKPG